ncbi:hypothetical protein DJ568_00785 [Mucilaginibacter hurinus]|uniref:Outer membrane protein beta-barrel domain-containing protein n=1 Tax=Mucilaginibacter hurinus TaxID=2201324 RepID=A0A367GTC4_9SPHI|nr:porin family protein [Mucilaginibacter hurinus]RCH56428.1 hypothetical protein DJ568_00785 [Mucilaginibacter hurinus]
MKKYLLSLCFVALFLTAYSQKTEVIIKGGINLGQFRYPGKHSDFAISGETVTGYQAGIALDLDISNSVSVQPGLSFIRTGTKYRLGGYPNNYEDGTIKINYLQLPVNFLYHLPVSAHDIHFGGGPFIGYALSGIFKKTNRTYNPGSDVPVVTESDGDLKFGGDINENYKRLNYGIGFTAGITLKNSLMFNINYDIGLTNISNSSIKAHTNILGISVGYVFK